MSNWVSSEELEAWLFDGHELALFDVREHGQYGEAHLFFAVNVPYSRLELDAIRLAPNRAVRAVVYDTDGGELAVRASSRLQALGYSHVFCLQGGTDGWQRSGRELFAGVHVPSKAFGEIVEEHCHTPHIGPLELASWQSEGRAVTILDGRPREEFLKMNIPGGVCCPNGELGLRAQAMVPDVSTPIVINCAGRTRSIIGAQTLINLGVPNPVIALENGTQGWFLADLELERGKDLHYPPAPEDTRELQRAAAALAERTGVLHVDAAQVEAWCDDQRRTLFVFDVRTPEEFAAGTLRGAEHAPGGQLVQATDLYVGVRGARIVVADDEGVRAPIVASWLRQLGHEAYVLNEGIHSPLELPEVAKPLYRLTPAELGSAEGVVFDLRDSASFIKRRARGSCWSTRSKIAKDAGSVEGQVWLLAASEEVAALAAAELPPEVLSSARWLASLDGLEVDEGGEPLAQAERIDYLFFVHDRHAGNKEAARQYLAWETGLLSQMTPMERQSFKPLTNSEPLATRLLHAGRGHQGKEPHGVNAPVSRLSTVLFDSWSQMREARQRRDHERLLSYGARGNPTAHELEDLITELEGGYRTKLFPTGLAATAQVLLTYLRPGDHVLITEGVYAPVRRLAEDFLKPFGISYEYYSANGTDLKSLIKPNTRMVYAEVPGSSYYSLFDLPAVANLCKPLGILVAVDNTWGSGCLYRPLELGADISIMALTKYVAGHSDVMMGSVCTTPDAFEPLSRMSDTVGQTVSPDDAWLVLRGARTLVSRLDVHAKQALEVAQWLSHQEVVIRVYHPALPTHPGHEIWRRDFDGSNGLLTVEFCQGFDAECFVDSLALFGIGASWGGFESLVTLVETDRQLGVRPAGPVVRLHIGLEAVSSLVSDIRQAMAKAV